MRVILQNMANGKTELETVPVRKISENDLLIKTSVSLISAGTERMLVSFGKANMLDKARQQPEKVKMVLDKARTDGIVTTYEAVKSKLDQPMPLGYCNVGVVEQVGEHAQDFSKGDRVISNGQHAEIVGITKNLCAKIPDVVTNEQAAFVIPASIGLQGIRLAEPTLGESFVVTGLGLIGLLTVQLLRAHGCRVLGIDFDENKLELARKFGAQTVSLENGEDAVEAGMAFSRGRGVDGVIITASTKSSDPVSQAARMCRKRGRIVLVGVVGLELNRSEFYEKELSFQVSCSYGPGRYDPTYEEQGQDYPFGFVRWTEQRNFEAVLDMMADRRLDVEPMISHRFSFDNAVNAYETLSKDNATLGILLEYENQEGSIILPTQVKLSEPVEYDSKGVVCAFLGAGNYASRILIPAFKKAGAQMHTIVSGGGVSATHHGKKAGFEIASTNADDVLNQEQINTVAIVTRHNSHADYVIKALKAKKNVFVEKPLALEHSQLEEIDEVYQAQMKAGNKPRLMVGFNRRFAPHIVKMKELLDTKSQPKSFIFTMNAGAIPADSWVQDIKIGGGRIIGEACHYVDLMRFLAGAEITSVQAKKMGDAPSIDVTEDKAAIILGFADGSFGTIHYYANGGKSFAKERIEAFAGDGVLQLNNFRKLRGFGWNGFTSMSLLSQNKGQDACAASFVKAIGDGSPTPIPYDQLLEVSKVSIDIATQIRNDQAT